MFWIAIFLGLMGLMLSAFFSGSETGFYRVAPVRLQLDAIGGNRIARGLIWLLNRPSIFIATTLVGNNLANYMVSMSIVLGMQSLMPDAESTLGELLMPLLLAPVLFVYGELLPKYLFLHAPHRMLRRGAPLFFLFVPLFAPISAALYLLNLFASRLLGESPDRIQLRLARRELRKVLDEGHELGILRRSQRMLSQAIFAIADHEVIRYATSLDDFPKAHAAMSIEQLLQLAQQHHLPEMIILERPESVRPVGYIRVVDLALAHATKQHHLEPNDLLPIVSGLPVRKLLEIPSTTSTVDSLFRMQSADEPLALVVDETVDQSQLNNGQPQPTGVIFAEKLRDLYFRGGRAHAT